MAMQDVEVVEDEEELEEDEGEVVDGNELCQMDEVHGQGQN